MFFSCEVVVKYLFLNDEVPSHKDTNNCFTWQAKDKIKYLRVVQILTFNIFYEKKCTLKEDLKILYYFWEQTVGKKPSLLSQNFENKR